MIKILYMISLTISVFLAVIYFKKMIWFNLLMKFNKRKNKSKYINKVHFKKYLSKSNINFILDVLFNINENNPYADKIIYITILIISGLTFLINFNLDIRTFQRTIILYESIFLIYITMKKIAYIKYYRQIFDFYIKMHNVTITDSNIMFNINKLTQSKKSNYLERQINMFCNKIRKNEKTEISQIIKKSQLVTQDYSQGQILYLIYNSHITGDKTKFLSDLSKLEIKALSIYEKTKNYLNSKMPYIILLIIMPILILFRGTFFKGIYNNSDISNKDPFEIVVIITLIFIIIVLELREL